MRLLYRKKFWIATVLITALVIGLFSVVAVNATENADKSVRSRASALASKSNSVFYSQIDNAKRNRTLWLYDLMRLSGKAQPADSSNPNKMFELAQSCGILPADEAQDMYLPLDRRFVARTMVKALGYPRRSIGKIADITQTDVEMATMAYYGYFLPDANDKVYPDARITEKEYSQLLMHLERYRSFKGKTIISFGDSIMHGSGNNDEGIAEILGVKYGMKATDYSVPGAAMGYNSERGHIRDQLAEALTDQVKPDIILLNGGTNDTFSTSLGKLTPGFDMSKTSEVSFTGGMERTLWTLNKYWQGVPVIYIRVHNMNLDEDAVERLYGEQAMTVAAKWSIPTVDLYNDTDMNTEKPEISNRYTYMDPNDNYRCDSIHPNAFGYAKFYYPLISEAIENHLNKE